MSYVSKTNPFFLYQKKNQPGERDALLSAPLTPRLQSDFSLSSKKVFKKHGAVSVPPEEKNLWSEPTPY